MMARPASIHCDGADPGLSAAALVQRVRSAAARFRRAAYGPFAQSRRLTARGDVIAVPTPGHTPDHLSVIVEEGDASVFLAGDASYTEHNMLEGRIDGVSASDEIAAATLKAIRDFATATPTVYLPTHDPDSAQRLTRRQTVASPGQPIQFERKRRSA